MVKSFVSLLLVLASQATISAQKGTGSEYEGWCSYLADSEKIEASRREDYLQECINSLEEADSKPDLAKSKRKRSGDDDG